MLSFSCEFISMAGILRYFYADFLQTRFLKNSIDYDDRKTIKFNEMEKGTFQLTPAYEELDDAQAHA